jgi:succinoglycan biosynthesis transport protein ExoP
MEQIKKDHLPDDIDQVKEVHLLDYVTLIRKRKWILIACVLVCLATAIIVNQTIFPTYKANCQIIIDKETNKSPVTGENMEYLYYETALSEELNFNTQLKVITSYEVLEQVIKKLGLQDREKAKKSGELANGGLGSHFKTAIRKNIKNVEDSVKSIKGFFLGPEREKGIGVNIPKGLKKGLIDDLPDKEMAAQVSDLEKNIDVQPIKDTRLVDITVSDDDPVWAAAIANGVVKSYMDYDTSIRYKSVREFVDWISTQIAEMRQKIDTSEKKFFDFKTNNKIYSFDEKKNIVKGKVTELNDAYIKIHTERMGIKAKILELENLLNRRKDRTIGKDLIDDPLLTDLSKELSKENILLDDLKRDYKDKHPEVLDAASKIEILKKEFNNTLQKSLKGLLMQDDVLKSREDTILSDIAKLEDTAIAENKLEATYSMLEREVETNKALYDVMLNKLKETKINETMKKSNVRVTEPASIPEIPSGSQKKVNIVLGFLLGMMGGLGLIFSLEYFETGIKTEDDVKQYLQLPVIGIIPEDDESKGGKMGKAGELQRNAGSTDRAFETDKTFETDKAGKTTMSAYAGTSGMPATSDTDSRRGKPKKSVFPLITHENCSTAFSEAYRSLRTNLTYSLGNGSPSKCILVTSSIPQEGKSTTASNLALTLAQAGGKVLLIDTDLRIPSIHKRFGLNHKSKGLTNILVDLFNTSLHEGTLQEYSLGDIISLINIQGRSGTLTISDHSEHFQLFFTDGEFIDAQAQDRPERKRLGALLVASQRITEEQRKNALLEQDYYHERLGSILLNMNLVKPEDLRGPLTLHFSSTMNRILTLKEGYFSFKDGCPQGADTSDYIKDKFSSWQKTFSMQAASFLEHNIFSVLQGCTVEGLKILTTGPLPSNPSELLGSRRMKALMHILKRRFDYIVLDSPPVNSVTDASILASLVDGVIQVIHVAHTNRKAAVKAKEQLDSIGARIFGIVMNRLDLKKDGYYYYNYYRYYQYGSPQRSSSEKGSSQKEDAKFAASEKHLMS